jgi:ankyrin repeat protein
MSALHHASRFGYENIVGFLLSAAPPSILDMREHEYGHTALHKAALHCRHNICSMLATCGASLTKADHQGLTAKQLAAKAGDDDLSAFLDRMFLFYY